METLPPLLAAEILFGAVGLFVGDLQKSLNRGGLEYWEIAQGVAVTYAMIGLLGGIITGIAIINWLSKRNKLDGAAEAANMPKSWLTGLEPEADKQLVAGYETTVSTSIDVIGFNLALILAGSGLAIILRAWGRSLDIPLIKAVLVWAYAIIVMWLVWLAMRRLGISLSRRSSEWSSCPNCAAPSRRTLKPKEGTS